MNRTNRSKIASDTLAIVKQGYYEVNNSRIDMVRDIDDCVSASRYYLPEELLAIKEQVLGRPRQSQASIEVLNETTLAGLQRVALSANAHKQPIGILNFASAKNPGGGFLGGSQAQEESLARSSALYSSLSAHEGFYQYHRHGSSCLYSDRMIFTPNCPVFKCDDGALLAQPILASFITSPAPNAGAIAQNSPHELEQIPQVLKQRAELVLALAAHHGLQTLILGAWGCGVFRNDPNLVAQCFAELLRDTWANYFNHIVFSVLDGSAEQHTLRAFEKHFSA